MCKYKYLVILICLSLTACENYLDVVPKGKVIPTALNDYRLMLDQTEYNGGSSGLIDCYLSDIFLGNDITVTPFSEAMYREAELNMLMFKEHVYLEDQTDGDWSGLYNQIYIANVVIEQVMDAADGTLEERESLRAEAYVHRAFAYWALVNLYAKHYNAATADEDLGVPLRLGIDFEESLKRASVQGVYNQILADLNNAVDKLPETPELNINYRPTNAAALGLLARVHLYMNNVDEAANFATQALALHNELIDFNTLGTSPIIPILLHYPVTLENKEVVFNKVVGSGNSMFYIHPDLVNLYDAANDLRYQTNCLPDWVFGANYGFVIAKFFGGQPTVGINTPELHLILAECYARKGGSANIGLAMGHLNTLRKKRYATGADYELNATDDQTALRLVKEERRRELCFNGQRLFDIKRFNLLDGDNIGVSRTISGEEYTIEASSPYFIMPIARLYIDLNNEIEQNER